MHARRHRAGPRQLAATPLCRTLASLLLTAAACAVPATAASAADPAARAPSASLVAPAATQPPLLDGDLADPCWTASLRLADFTRPESNAPPAQPVEARVTYDDSTLYLAVACSEADTSRIRARRELVEGDLGVWQDDCVEVWIRSGLDGARFHQFIVNARRLTETHFGPNGLPGSDRTYGLRAGARIEADRWICELAIPFGDLDLPAAPVPGEIVEIKLGREDYASGGREGAQLASWPPGTPYGRTGYGVVHFGRDNLLEDPTFTGTVEQSHGTGSGPWKIRGDAEVESRADASHLTLQPGGRASQVVTLAGGSLYRLSCKTSGAGSGLLQVLPLDDQSGGPPLQTTFHATDAWQTHHLSVPVSAGGRYQVILSVNSSGGAVSFSSTRLAPDPSRPVAGRAIPLPSGGDGPFVIRQVPVTDARAVRGFLHPPIDGTTDSRGWDGGFWEYPSPGPGAGVYYEHPHRNDGLHLTLADSLGVNAIQVRGGVRANVVADVQRFDDPASGRLIHTFPGRASSSLAWFDQPVLASKLSFFRVQDGYISDITFFRTGGEARNLGEARRSPLTVLADTAAAGPFRPATSRLDQASTLGASSTLGEDSRAGGTPGSVEAPTYAAFGPPTSAAAPAVAPTVPSIHLSPGVSTRLVAGPWPADTAIAALGLEAALPGRHHRTRLTIRIQDPVYPRTAVTTATVAPPTSGPLNLALDLPDLVLRAGTPLWLTLTSDEPLVLDRPHLVLYTAPRAVAHDEALARALLKLKGFFQVLSEPRPWTGFRRDTDVTAFLAGKGRLATQLLELRDGIEYCHWLAPHCDVVRQYYQWFYRGKLRPELPEAKLPDAPGAPEWAVAARTAWLAARSVSDWWLTHRDTPGGELGSGIGDDTDMYQNYIDFPFLEADGVAARLREGAGRLAELVDEHRLEQGLNRMVTDPLHAYEEGANHVALMTRWHYGDPVYFERCMDNARNTWALTTVNAAGHRHFKSQMLGAADLRLDRATDVDGGQHPLMLHGACEVVWYNRNPLALQLLREWGDAWLAHQQPGEYATHVEVATDKVVGSQRAPWEGGYGSQGGVFKFLYEATGNSRYLRPVREFYNGGNHDGTLDRRATDLYQLAAFDDHPEVYEAMAPHSPGLQWVLHGDKAPLVAELKAAAAEIQTFGHMYTAAEVFTDRIFLAVATRAPALAYTGGFGTRNKLYRSHGVSWEGFGTRYAALVRSVRPNRFEALVYSFAREPVSGSLRLWNARHGGYAMTTGVDTDGDDRPDAELRRRRMEVVRGAPIPIELAPGQVTTIELVWGEGLEPLWRRADLALSAREVAVTGTTLKGVVHNIGSAAANAVVALVDAEGRVRARQNLGQLQAPLDLHPRRRDFHLEVVDDSLEGWTLVVDPDGDVPEITEGNNAVQLGGIARPSTSPSPSPGR